jgi:protoporphyrin/coproporphyrin ferrochelatase
MSAIDSILLVGFGGPIKPEEIMPFLETVVRGRNVPRERLEEVAHHYHEIGGRSPYNELAFRQAEALRRTLRDEHDLPLPVYVGMRNWHPFISETIREMNQDGRRHAAGIILAAHRSNTSLERYRLDVTRAIEANGGAGPEVAYIGPFFEDPLFLEANAQRIEEATGYRRGRWPQDVPVLFTAHSIPCSMAQGSSYVEDLLASCRGAAGILDIGQWRLAYQSRSGDGRVPWLEPDVNDVLRELAGEGVKEVVVQPIGFLHDHVEVLYDLDVEARATAREAGLRFHRAGTVGDHPAFIEMLAQRVVEIATGERGSVRSVGA